MSEKKFGGAAEGKTREGQEYNPRALTLIVQRSFEMSQGGGLGITGNGEQELWVQGRIFPALFAMYPALATSTMRWTKRARWAAELRGRNFDDNRIDEDGAMIKVPEVETYVREVSSIRRGKAHVQGQLALPLDDRVEAYKALKYFLDAADQYANVERRLPKEEQAQRKQEHIAVLAKEIIKRDLQILKAFDNPSPSDNTKWKEYEKLRASKGHSMFCLYALSEKRHTKRDNQQREFQKLWEEMGQYVRANFVTLDQETKKGLRILIKRFEKTTNEKIALP